ncbi:MAG TPA: adenylate/guanylate cyclase domain-containing protein [Chitinivibrionales bacterium]|nr:adenylate/guanylate cyclase domain-containing protein [Chitinivibrionales bacterium]
MDTPIDNVVRQYFKYVFLDVVSFSTRSAEAQSAIVTQLNSIVKESIDTNQDHVGTNLIPTGDGMCIALFAPNLQYDSHIQVALQILALLEEYNLSEKNEMRQFKVRIGIHQNTDIFVTDVNGRDNIAGAGINLASRIVDKADGCQILVSHTVHEELQPSEKYRNRFKKFDAIGKHGIQFSIYQYVDTSCLGLNCAIPIEFIPEEKVEPKLSLIAAYYFAHAIKEKDFILRMFQKDVNMYAATVLLWFLSQDSLEKREATDLDPFEPKIYGEGKKNLDEVIQYYSNLQFYLISEFSNFVEMKINKYPGCFSSSTYGYLPLFLSQKGKEKLKSDWPDIYDEFKIT